MNWDAIGAIGEILGALAVVTSLLYLATQIRGQNREAKVAAVHDISQALGNHVSQLQDPEKAELLVEAMSGWDDFSPTSRLRFIGFFIPALRIFEDGYFQWRQGRLEEATWNTMIAQLTDFMDNEGARKCWEMRKHQFREDFVCYVDRLPRTTYRL